jgi:cell division transport system ATP-binding protein
MPFTPARGQGMIEFEAVTKSYLAARPVLESADLRIGKGDFFYLTGVSGSGKTTVFRLLMRLERPSEGAIRLDGREVTALRPAQVPLLRRRVGMVFQDYRLLADISVEDNVALPLRVAGWSAGRVRGRVDECLDWVGLSDRRDQPVRTLSGGEQQLTAIARAMVFDPPVVLADEPTGNLDQNMAFRVMSLLQRLNEQGTTVVVATHDLNLIRSFRARTLLIKDRRIHEVRLVQPGESAGAA